MAEIPEELAALRQWVVWRTEARGGKPTKVPYSPHSVGSRRASCRDPGTWGSLGEAYDALMLGDRILQGLGFVFTESDPFCGVDLDGVIDPESRKREAWAMKVVKALDSYSEVSPSGTGLHVIVKARLPGAGNRKGSKDCGIEMYDKLRYFCVTADPIPGSPTTINERQRQLESLHRRLFPASGEDEVVDARPAPRVMACGLPEYEDVVDRASRAENGDKFAALWAGDASGYESRSEADLALCSMLFFWIGPDRARVEEMFSRSGLARQKWIRRPEYRNHTLDKALSGNREFYEGRSAS